MWFPLSAGGLLGLIAISLLDFPGGREDIEPGEQLRVTTWAEYGLIVSLHLAKQNGSDTHPTPAREMALREGLPRDYVEQILLKLRRAGLVGSVRGAKGGYYLSREPDKITVKHVIEAAEDHTFEVNCDSHMVDPDRCRADSPCSIRPVWRALQQRIDDLLESISLADLMSDEFDVERLVSITRA